MLKNSYTKKFGALLLAMALTVSTLAGCTNTTPSSSTPSSDAPSSGAPSSSAPEATTPTKMEGDEFDNGAIGKHGGVSSSSEYSSQAGIDILKAGGNAVDAAIATAFAIGVTEPNLSGIGGCGMMNIYLKETNEYVMIEYMETVPAAVKPGWYDPKTESKTAKNAAVPSQVYGLLTALEKYGTMSREEVMAPAIKLAKEGFKMDKRLADAVSGSFDTFSVDPAISSVYVNDGLPYAEGDLFKNPQLAAILEAVAKGGIDEFYKGETAKKIVDGLQAGGSLISMEDMANYKAEIREPIRTTYLGYEVVSPPPPSNGGDWLLELLNIMENFDMKAMGHNTPEYLFYFNEASRIALADSYAYIGDPAFYNLPIKEMTSKEFGKQRAEQISKDKKVLTEIPASDLPIEKLNPTGEESLHTSHIAVIDEKGNIVSTTNTLGNAWGCNFMVADTGFFYNSHMGNMEHDPAKSDSPDYVMPGKRVRSTISPSLILKDGEPIMAIGSPGSLAIPPAIATVMNNVFLFDMNIQQAINAPRAMAIDRFSTKMTIEGDRYPAETIKALEDMGYVINDVGEYNMAVGGIAAIYLDKEAGIFYAGADPRRNYKALAY